MASSKSTSVSKAQIPSFCHLCEDSPNIQWKCVDCDLLMCSKCKTKVHSKFKAADDHDVISLKDVSLGVEPRTKLNQPNTACKVHIDQKVCLYCKTCGEMACPICVTDNHKKHDLEDLHKVYADRVCLLQYIYDEMEADMNLYVDEENKIKTKQIGQDILIETRRQEILSQKEQLVTKVDLEASKILQKLDSIKAKQDDSLSSAKADNLRIQREMKSKMSTLKDVLNGNCMDTIINADEKLIPSLVNIEMPFRNESSPLLTFSPGTIYQEQVSEMFGILQQTIAKPGVKLDVVMSQKSDLEMVSNLYTCKNGNILMCDEVYTKRMRRTQIQDNRVKTLKDIDNVRVFDITETKKNEFLISFVDKTTIERFRPDGTFETFLDLSPLLPRALHYTRSGKLLVGVREHGTLGIYPPKQTSQRKLLVMQVDKKIIHEYNLDNHNKRLFTNVGRVTSGTNNHIYLLDWTSLQSEGSVVAVRFPDKIVWRYSGNDSIQTDLSFRPNSMVITEVGNIVVSDLSNFLHILNYDGSLKSFINTSEHGIIFPISMTLDSSGLLYVGCSTSKAKTTNAMLYALKFSGF